MFDRKSMKKTFNLLLVMLIILTVVVSGCGKPKPLTFANYKNNWNSIVKQGIEKNNTNLPESALKLPDAKPNKDYTGKLVYNIPIINITQTKNMLVVGVDESDRITTMALHAAISGKNEADAKDDFNQVIDLATIAIASMKAPDSDKAQKILLGASDSGYIQLKYLLGRKRTYTDENGNEYSINATEGDSQYNGYEYINTASRITLVIKPKLESK